MIVRGGSALSDARGRPASPTRADREPAAAHTLRHEQQRPLPPGTAAQWLKDYSSVYARAKRRPGYLGAQTVPTYAHLQDDAAQMLRILSGRAMAPEFLLHEHQRRQPSFQEPFSFPQKPYFSS